MQPCTTARVVHCASCLKKRPVCSESSAHRPWHRTGQCMFEALVKEGGLVCRPGSTAHWSMRCAAAVCGCPNNTGTPHNQHQKGVKRTQNSRYTHLQLEGLLVVRGQDAVHKAVVHSLLGGEVAVAAHVLAHRLVVPAREARHVARVRLHPTDSDLYNFQVIYEHGL